jgi:hypothetical protein
MRFEVDSAVTIENCCVIACQDQELRAQPVTEETMSYISDPSVLAGLVFIVHNFDVFFCQKNPKRCLK